jgi:hypothetical protein
MFSRFAAYPGLLAAMSKPHVMAALSDVSANPDNISKYRCVAACGCRQR